MESKTSRNIQQSMEVMEKVTVVDGEPYWRRLIPGVYKSDKFPKTVENRNKQARRFARHRGAHPSIAGDDGTCEPEPTADGVPIPPSYQMKDIGRRWHSTMPDLPNAHEKPEVLNPLTDVVKFIKIIGRGGQGFIALCEFPTSKGKNGKPMRRVVKVAKSADHQSLGTEIRVMDHLRAAKHLCRLEDEHFLMYYHQMIVDGKNPGAFKDAMRTYYLRENRENAETHPRPRFAVLEHMELGQICHWIAKASKLNKPWPDRLLWMLFRDLVKGLIGMAYPIQGGHLPVDEVIPQRKNPIDPKDYTPCQLVHFDLDVFNVLVGYDPDHESRPIFKIADFGLTANYSPGIWDLHRRVFNDTRFWRQRSLGKPINFTPEQFHEDWDEITPYGVDENDKPTRLFTHETDKPEIAGNYAMHTNVFQVGIVMWMAICRRAFDPPVSKGDSIKHGAAHPLNRSTYGWAIRDLKGIDELLLRLVVSCLNEKPSDRPSLLQLQTTINFRFTQGFPDMSDAALDHWCEQFFDVPHRPPPSGRGGGNDDGAPPPHPPAPPPPPGTAGAGKRKRGKGSDNGPDGNKRHRDGDAAEQNAGMGRNQVVGSANAERENRERGQPGSDVEMRDVADEQYQGQQQAAAPAGARPMNPLAPAWVPGGPMPSMPPGEPMDISGAPRISGIGCPQAANAAGQPQGNPQQVVNELTDRERQILQQMETLHPTIRQQIMAGPQFAQHSQAMRQQALARWGVVPLVPWQAKPPPLHVLFQGQAQGRTQGQLQGQVQGQPQGQQTQGQAPVNRFEEISAQQQTYAQWLERARAQTQQQAQEQQEALVQQVQQQQARRQARQQPPQQQQPLQQPQGLSHGRGRGQHNRGQGGRGRGRGGRGRGRGLRFHW